MLHHAHRGTPADGRDRPTGWKQWIVEDFGADEQLVEDMLAKVDALRDSLPEEAFQRYGQ